MDDVMQELKSMRIWVLWRYVNKDGGKSKVPFSAKGGKTGSNEEYFDSYVTYEEALAVKDKMKADGISFRVPEGYYFIDLDDMELDSPIVREIVKRHDTYMEHSVSGHGFHMYGKCDFKRIPVQYSFEEDRFKLDEHYYVKNSESDIEIYIGGLTNRFAGYTGKVVHNKPLKDDTDALLETLDTYMIRNHDAEENGEPVSDYVCEESTESIIEGLKHQKNGFKFLSLFEDGDISGYGSQSEADAALCALIAFRTGPDEKKIDEIFCQSALYREKWDRADYKRNTIKAGIKSCHGNFYKRRKSAPPFIYIDKNDKVSVLVPELAQYVREHLCYRIVRNSGKEASHIYVYENGCYRFYSNEMMMGIVKKYIEDYDPSILRLKDVSSAIEHLKTDLDFIPEENLDSDENIINFQNGILRITGDNVSLTPHNPEILSTIQLPCRWTGYPKPTPVFDAYMDTLADGDEDVKRLLMEFIGVCLSNVKGYRMKKALFLVGDGNTGKSQLKSLVERILGPENCIGIDLKEIEARFGTGAIYGTRLAGSSDMSFLSVDELKAFKKITGGDSLFAERKGEQGYHYTYKGLLWFCMNRLPKFGGDDGQWVYDRIITVECPNVIPFERQDRKLLDKMYEERDGIVYKVVKALRQVIRNGYTFDEPDKIKAARENYRNHNSTVISFFRECMCPLKSKLNLHCTTGRVYKVYQAWCKDNNNGFTKTAREFRDELSEYLKAPYSELTTRQKGNTYYKAYGLTEECKDNYSLAYGNDSSDFLAG